MFFLLRSWLTEREVLSGAESHGKLQLLSLLVTTSSRISKMLGSELAFLLLLVLTLLPLVGTVETVEPQGKDMVGSASSSHMVVNSAVAVSSVFGSLFRPKTK